MDSLLPSEIARLVYGYLVEEKCDAAAQLFLETSEPLKECYLASKKGRNFNTRILGLSLIDILNIYTDAVCMLKNYKEKKRASNDSGSDKSDCASLNIELSNVIQELENVLFVGENSEKNKQKTIFVRISIPSRKKSSTSESNCDKKEARKKSPTERKEKGKEKVQNQGGDESFENTTVSKNVSSSLDDFDLNMLQKLLDNTALHERIAENINKAIDSSGDINPSETNEKKIVETVLHSTEADPIFEELLHMLTVPRTEDTTTPEDTDKEGGDPVEERPGATNEAISEDQETIKTIEAENNRAIEGILAGNKSVQEPITVVAPSNDVIVNQGGDSVLTSTPLPLMTSSPLQPVVTGLPTLVSILSPVQAHGPGGPTLFLPVVQTLRSDVRRKNCFILPKASNETKLQDQNPVSDKTENIHIVPTNDVQNPGSDKTEKIRTVPPFNGVGGKLNIPRVRTRGGLHKGTSRGLKSISPQITRISEDKINVVLLEKNDGVKTRSMAKANTQGKEVLNKLDVIQEENNVSEKNYSLDKKKQTEPEQNSQLSTCDSDNLSTVPVLSVEPQISTPVVETENAETFTDSKISEKKESEKMSMATEEPNIENLTVTNNNVINPTEEKLEKNSFAETETRKSDDSLVKNYLTEKCGNSSHFVPKEMDGNGTPQKKAMTTKARKRVSLSTPRRGSHVRVLDFKTPDKAIISRKSLTSPKDCSKSEKIDLKVEKAKRGILKSPECKKKNVCNKKKESTEIEVDTKIEESVKFTPPKRDWDADLRKFMDIPTSVGLKRKNTVKKDAKKKVSKKKTSRKNVPKKNKKKNVETCENVESPETLLTPTKLSSEDLVEQIEKEVREVIHEEEISLHSSKEIDNILKSNIVNSEISNKSSSCSENMEIDEQTLDQVVKSSDKVDKQGAPDIIPEEEENAHLKKNNDNSQNIVDGTVVDTTTISDSSKIINAPVQNSVCSDASTPLKTFLSPHKDKATGQFTPWANLILDQPSLNYSPNIIPEEEENSHLRKNNDNLQNIVDGTVVDTTTITDSSKIINAPVQNSVCSDASTPLKTFLSPHKDEATGQLTPRTNLILDQLSLNSSPSFSNLESILISEGARLEQENTFKNAKSDQTNSPDQIGIELQEEKSSNPQASNCKKNNNVDDIKRHIPIDCVLKQSVPQTPAKFLAAPVGTPVEATPAGKTSPGFLIEMTPLSKALHSSTKLSFTKLVSPTLPVTPKLLDENSPNKTVSSSSDNDSENDKNSLEEKIQVDKNKDLGSLAQENTIPSSKTIPDGISSTESIDDLANENCALKEKESKVINSPSIPTIKKFKPKTPLVKLLERKPKIVKPTTVKKTIKKPNTRRILSSSESEEETDELENKKSLASNSPDQSNASMSAHNPLNEANKKRNACTPKPKQNLGEGNKNVKKHKKPSPKKHFDINLMKQEEQVLKECLEKAKAQALFGFISTDSDSSDDTVTPTLAGPQTSNLTKHTSKSHELLKPELKNALVRLKKIKSASMLLSSSTSDDDDEDLNASLSKSRLPQNETSKVKNPSKIDLPKPLETHSSNSMSKVTSNLFSQALVSSENKKMDSPKKAGKEITKSESREKEESCESFPALYLSEESNISGISETHNMRFLKSKKSPSVGSDNLHLKKPIISSSNLTLKTNSHKSNHSKLPLASSKSLPTAKPKEVKELPDVYDSVHTTSDVYERVHTTSTAPVAISGQESKALSEYLKNYSFSFTIDEEGDFDTKTLKTSPFFTILEMDFKKENVRRERTGIKSPYLSPQRNRCDRSTRRDVRDRNSSPKKDRLIRNPSPQREHHERKSSPQRVRHDRLPSPRNLPSQRDRHRKRPRSDSSSSDDARRSNRRYPSKIRRDFRENRDYPRRNNFPREKSKFFSSRFQNSPYYRERFDIYRGPKLAPTEDSNRPRKRSCKEYPDKSPTSLQKFKKYYDLNDSLRSSRSHESDRLLVDQSFEHPDSPLEKSRISESSHPSLRDTRQRKSTFKLVREDGELSDTSEFHSTITPDNVTEVKRKKLNAAEVPDPGRANLLNKVDLDSFLTLLHGAEEEK